MHVVPGSSVVVPLIIEGLPRSIDVLGEHWLRKREFHMTALAAELVERATVPEPWDAVVEVASGRSIGPINPGREFRRVTHPDKPGLRTLIVMVHAPGLNPLYAELSEALGVPLEVPPAHVTLYSNDPAEGIGIVDQAQLRDRAPALGAAQHEEVRHAIGALSPTAPPARSRR